MKKAAITPGVIVERVGDDLMVIVPGNTDVVSLSGRPAEVLLDVQAGREIDPSDPALKTLNDLGIVTSPGMSRRGLITAGALGAGAGIAVMAMPGVAAASSRPIATPDGTTPPDDSLTLFRGDSSNEFLVAVPGWDGQITSGVSIVSVSESVNGEVLKDEFSWVSDGVNDDDELVFLSFQAGSFAPADITGVRLEFTLNGEPYVAIYTATV